MLYKIDNTAKNRNFKKGQFEFTLGLYWMLDARIFIRCLRLKFSSNLTVSNSVCNVRTKLRTPSQGYWELRLPPYYWKATVGELKIWEALLGSSSISLVSSCLLICHVHFYFEVQIVCFHFVCCFPRTLKQ